MSFLSRFFGPPRIATLLRKKDIDGLLQALRSPTISQHTNHIDVKRLNEAVDALVQLADAATVSKLSTFLGEQRGEYELAAVALGRIGSQPAIDALLRALKSQGHRLRSAAIKG